MQTDAKFAVLWDMDGTLVDTGEPHYITWRDTLAEIGVPYTRQDFAATFGMNNFGVLEVVFGKKPDHELANSLIEKKEELFREMIFQGLEPLPGIMDWLNRFRQWGVKQAIASSAPCANIDAELDVTGIRPYFDIVISGADLPHKPNPDIFLKAATELGVPPERCVVVEDSVAGLGGALAAGMKCIAVTTTHPPEELTAANLIFNDLTQMDEKAFLRLTGWEL
ncbi:MAG: HAD-IA family hydrolase [Anaerolineales bacterium]|nr:HAD-IA family hydrolase [Anaerolineales bacterium]